MGAMVVVFGWKLERYPLFAYARMNVLHLGASFCSGRMAKVDILKYKIARFIRVGFALMEQQFEWKMPDTFRLAT
jgi:hypothetical protein